MFDQRQVAPSYPPADESPREGAGARAELEHRPRGAIDLAGDQRGQCASRAAMAAMSQGWRDHSTKNLAASDQKRGAGSLENADHVGREGTMLHDRRRLATSVLAGLTVWNMAFMTLGFVMVRLTGSSNATLITLSFGFLLGAALLSRPMAVGALDVARSVAHHHRRLSRRSLRPADRSFEQ